MFVSILLFTLAIILYLSIRDWMYGSSLSSKRIQKIHNQISQHLSLNEWDEVEKLLKLLSERKKNDRNSILFEIQMLEGMQRYEEALEKTIGASREFPEDLLFRLEEGKILIKLGKAKEALEAFYVSSPIMRTESDFLSCAKAHFQNNAPDKCLEMLEPWIKFTQNGELAQLAADACFELKYFKEAITFYTKCADLGFQTQQVLMGLGHSYRRLGNLSKAEEIFYKLLEKDVNDLGVILGLGACLQERGHFQKALLIYQSSVLWETKHPKLLKEAALCALYTKKYAYAERYFLEVIQKEELSEHLLAYYGFVLECQKKWQEAEQVYVRMVQLFPSSAHGFLALGWLFGVGLSTTLSQNQALNFAHLALKIKNDMISWEILSAVEARVGNFERAYQIQQSLAFYDEDKESKIRRQSALRSLRKNVPLGGSHVLKTLVA